MKLLFEHQNFFHPSIIPYQGKLMMVMQKQLAMDRYTVPHFSFSENGGANWSEPQEIVSLKQFDKCADFRPLPIPGSDTVGIIGIVYIDGGYKAVYLTYNGTWSEPIRVPGTEFRDDRAAGTQIAVDENGILTIPFFYFTENQTFCTVTRKYRWEQECLQHLATGTPLSSASGRGWYEPSVILQNGTYYLTMRCDENCAMLTQSPDGLHWSVPVKWQFSDGTPLETGPTQQHWMRQKDELWLVYTRHDSSNEDCFRWRAPMFAAPFDTKKMLLVKEREIILLPRIDYKDRPGTMGNFNITNLPDCSYISDAPLWFDWTPDRQAIAWFSTSVLFKKITF